MNSIELGVFVAVAEAGAIGRAALQLNTVQSNVTQRVRALEDKLGVPLFHRSKQGVTLTTVGERLLPYARRVAELLEEARLVASDDAVPGGELRIGAMETVAALRLPPILASYSGRYPDVSVTIATGTTEALVARVLHRELEGAFVAGPAEHAELTSFRIAEEELVLATAPRISGVAELRRDGRAAGKVIVFRAGCSYRQRTDEFLAREGLVSVPRMEMGTFDGIVGCVTAGVGFALLPRAVIAAAISDGRIRAHALPNEIAHAETVFVQRRDTFVTAALRCFVECIAEQRA
ncbi:LysR family transcriptional regulator [Tardiphaga alba]|uniref:LysR family transcriptional regulator n=1 Tax=Tardiphaga alba TaxID=340268 RepID=A0ABX8A9H7_9BRAD|nr:LysR family transcriptional regulator [Tardiphaga alba]QUS39656.1 LysR family transcriptional regulator [Tardiphaga alba]